MPRALAPSSDGCASASRIASGLEPFERCGEWQRQGERGEDQIAAVVQQRPDA